MNFLKTMTFLRKKVNIALKYNIEKVLKSYFIEFWKLLLVFFKYCYKVWMRNKSIINV